VCLGQRVVNRWCWSLGDKDAFKSKVARQCACGDINGIGSGVQCFDASERVFCVSVCKCIADLICVDVR
jgi:hypothetical protein